MLRQMHALNTCWCSQHGVINEINFGRGPPPPFSFARRGEFPLITPGSIHSCFNYFANFTHWLFVYNCDNLQSTWWGDNVLSRKLVQNIKQESKVGFPLLQQKQENTQSGRGITTSLKLLLFTFFTQLNAWSKSPFLASGITFFIGTSC